MKKRVYSSVITAVFLGLLVGCNSTTSDLELTELDQAKEKTTRFAKNLLGGKDITQSQFTQDVNYDASKTPILVDSEGNIIEGGTIKYFDDENHSVVIVATGKNQLTISIDFNDDGKLSDEEIYVAIGDDGAGNSGSSSAVAPIDVPVERETLKEWLDDHNAADSTDVFISLPSKVVAPPTKGDIQLGIAIIDTEATKTQILDFVDENNLTRNDSINEAIENGWQAAFEINLTKEKIEALLEKYDENLIWIDLVSSVIIID
jgi:hypothetical protein